MSKWKFKKDAPKQGSSDGFWYDITAGGYISPEAVLEDKDQIEKVLTAILVLKSFEHGLEEAELLEEF